MQVSKACKHRCVWTHTDLCVAHSFLKVLTHSPLHTHSLSWPRSTGTSPTASVISFCTGKHWSGVGAQLYYCGCVCVYVTCVCVPICISMIHQGWAVKSSTSIKKALLLSRSLCKAHSLLFFLTVIGKTKVTLSTQ